MSETEIYWYQMKHPLLKLLNLRDNLVAFKQLGDETIQEMWLKFQTVLQPCPTHGISDKVLLECFYRGLGLKNRSTTDQLFTGDFATPTLWRSGQLLYSMVETNKEIKKKQEWEALVTEVDFLSKSVMELEAQSTKNDKHFSLRECKK